MSLPALHNAADTRSITERVNVLIRAYNGDARILQTVSTQTGAVATGITTIPLNDTKPDQSVPEGDQYMSLAITPKSSLSTLVIDVSGFWASSAASGTMVAALFQDDTAEALAVGWDGIVSAGNPVELAFRHEMTSGTESETTFKVRAGLGTAGTTTFNGAAGNRFFGGALASGIRIQEVLYE